jgi:hypothetical protein
MHRPAFEKKKASAGRISSANLEIGTGKKS